METKRRFKRNVRRIFEVIRDPFGQIFARRIEPLQLAPAMSLLKLLLTAQRYLCAVNREPLTEFINMGEVNATKILI